MGNEQIVSTSLTQSTNSSFLSNKKENKKINHRNDSTNNLINLTSLIINQCLVNEVNSYHNLNILYNLDLYVNFNNDISLQKTESTNIIENNKYLNSCSEMFDKKSNGSLYLNHQTSPHSIIDYQAKLNNIIELASNNNNTKYNYQSSIGSSADSYNSTIQSSNHINKINMTLDDRISPRNLNLSLMTKNKKNDDNNKTFFRFNTHGNNNTNNKNPLEGKNVIYSVDPVKYKDYLNKSMHSNKNNASMMNNSNVSKSINHGQSNKETLSFHPRNKELSPSQNINMSKYNSETTNSKNKDKQQFEDDCNSYIKKIQMKKITNKPKIKDNRSRTPTAINKKNIKVITFDKDKPDGSCSPNKESKLKKYQEYCKKVANTIQKKEKKRNEHTPKRGKKVIHIDEKKESKKINCSFDGNTDSQKNIFTVISDVKVKTLKEEIEEKEHKNKKEIKLFDPLETIKEATDEFGSSSNISTGGIERFSFKPNIKNEEDKTHKPNRKKTPIKKKKENKFTFII